jgi:hypothetical protein
MICFISIFRLKLQCGIRSDIHLSGHEKTSFSHRAISGLFELYFTRPSFDHTSQGPSQGRDKVEAEVADFYTQNEMGRSPSPIPSPAILKPKQ